MKKGIYSFLQEHWLELCGLSLAILVSYLNAIPNDFVSDDKTILTTIKTWNTDVASRLVMGWTFHGYQYLLYRVFDLNPYIFHLGNILMHLETVLGTYVFLCLVINPVTALFASLIFSVHPILTESVTWISGGKYLIYSMFFIWSLVFYRLSFQRKKLLWISAILFLLSCFSSEKAIVLFPIYFLFEYIYGNLKKRWKNLLPFFAINVGFGIYMVAFSLVGKRLYDLQTDYSQTPGLDNLVSKIPLALASYFKLFIWPHTLTFYHTDFLTNILATNIRIDVTIAFIIITLYCFIKKKFTFFWLLWFLIPLLPSLTPLQIGWIVAERYLYLSTIALSVLVAMGLYRLYQQTKYRRIVIVVLSLIIPALTVRTIIRNADWQNEDTLWIATQQYSPNSPQNHNNLGDMYARHKQYDLAVKEFKIAISLLPLYPEAYHNMGNAYIGMGNLDEAVNSYLAAVDINPRLWQTYRSLSSIFLYKKQNDTALRYIKTAVSLNPSAELYTILGNTYRQIGDIQNAKASYQLALKTNPTYMPAQVAMEELNATGK